LEQAQELSAEGLWTEVSARLRETLNESTYNMGFAGARPGQLDGGAFVLFVPNDFTREWVESHVLGLLETAVRDVLGGERDVHVVAREPQPKADALLAPPSRQSEGLNAKYTFDSFVIGSSNRFAHAAALAVAEAPAQAYNPLFIYGGTGLGKTHLLQAIADYTSPSTRVRSQRAT
jgi:chromosomal replication initiator protein